MLDEYHFISAFSKTYPGRTRQGQYINGTASLATCSNLSTGATDSYKVMAANLAPYNQYNDMTNVNTSRWVTIGFSTNVTGNIAISEWWLE